MIRKLLLALAFMGLASPALAQNTTCSDRPSADYSNACANTRFVNNTIIEKSELVYNSVTAVQNTIVPAAARGFKVLGYLAFGDGGLADYTRSVGPSGPGKIQSLDGAWWLLNEPEPNELQFGAVAAATNAAQTAAIQASLDYCTVARCSRTRLIRTHTQTANISVPAGVEWDFATGTNALSLLGFLIKGFNGDMITLAGSGSILRNAFLYGDGANFTGRGIVVTGNFIECHNCFITDTEGAAVDFPTASQGQQYSSHDGVFQRHTPSDPAITFPTTEPLTNGFRRFYNPSAGGGTLFKFNNGNLTQVFGGDSACLDYSATTTGRITVTGHRVGCAVTIFGTEGHFEGNTVGTTLTLGLGTSLYSVDGNVISSGEVVNNSGNTNNRIGQSVGVPGTNDQILFGVTSGQPVYRSVTGDVTFSTGVATIGATKVTSAMLNADVYATAHTWAGVQTLTNPITAPTTVTGLPSCAAGTKGMRSFVTDNNTALAFAAVITTGGTIQTPVYCDGTVWRQG